VHVPNKFSDAELIDVVDPALNTTSSAARRRGGRVQGVQIETGQHLDSAQSRTGCCGRGDFDDWLLHLRFSIMIGSRVLRTSRRRGKVEFGTRIV
jgi:hypothetical protein